MVKLPDKTAEDIELMLDEADRTASESDIRYTAEEVFGRLRKIFSNDMEQPK